MTLDPKLIQQLERESADDAVIDPDLEPYDETVEKPIGNFVNFIPPEEV